ncbi:DUF427 domain-containing protein [Plantibacter sp. ME-Dv--P-122b]|uniref:DUF427 domain-containing protein n=1 Tax=Plantibacter sp. ME-Dv--P-122b TaxID=3040300 RepID=UPI002550442F|nr:DUF427 domain-containing protein [Plantibacter sp. ME-Dv--P-122b]
MPDSSRFRRPLPVQPGPGEESVWEYPRPPRVEPRDERVVIRFGGTVIAESTAAVRVLETSHPPVYYVPAADFSPGVLVPVDGTTMCEFKGEAHYLDVRVGDAVAAAAAWTYPDPRPGFAPLFGMIAVYPGRMDACEVDGVPVRAQEGDFYGGWITPGIVGPFKGAPGTRGW